MGPPKHYPHSENFQEARKAKKKRFPRQRRCLLKGCGRYFHPEHFLQRYCGAECQEAAEIWRNRQYRQNYRQTENGKKHRREQSRRRRQKLAKMHIRLSSVAVKGQECQGPAFSEARNGGENAGAGTASTHPPGASVGLEDHDSMRATAAPSHHSPEPIALTAMDRVAILAKTSAADCSSEIQSSTSSETSPTHRQVDKNGINAGCVGKCNKKNFAEYLCSRPGCYELFSLEPRAPHKKFCSPLCRNALRRVLQREAYWLKSLRERLAWGKKPDG